MTPFRPVYSSSVYNDNYEYDMVGDVAYCLHCDNRLRKTVFGPEIVVAKCIQEECLVMEALQK